MDEQTSPVAPSILFVDDEANILSALRRLFRGQGYHLLTAGSAAEGLAILEREPVDIVVSDMRMPEMNGDAFLELVRQRWPPTLRLLLTGYAEVSAIIGAINRGEVYRYIAKPWQDHDMLLEMRTAVERVQLARERRALLELTAAQNDALRDLNATLESRVAERTLALKTVNDALGASNERLKNNFLTSIKMLGGIVEIGGFGTAGHARRVAELARQMASQMQLAAKETQNIFIAGLLHELGKVALPEDVLAQPESMLKGERLGVFRRYPTLGGQLLMPVEELREVASMIRSHRERFDGSGFPEQLAGLDIPVGARVLALASDYFSAQSATLSQHPLRVEQAVEFIISGSGRRYDPDVVAAFHCARNAAKPSRVDQAVSLAQLHPGMKLSRDLHAAGGALLLSAEHVLNARLIGQITEFAQRTGQVLTANIY